MRASHSVLEVRDVLDPTFLVLIASPVLCSPTTKGSTVDFVRVLEVRWVDRPRCAPSLTAVVRNSTPLPCGCDLHPCSATMLRCLAPLLRYQAVWSPPVFAACVCDLSRVRVLVRLSHPRPLDRSQHGCTVDVLPGPTRVLPMPRQCGIGRRAPTRAVLSCAALWCLVHVVVWIVSSLRFVLCPLAEKNWKIEEKMKK